MPHFFPGSGNGGLHNGNAIAWNAGNSFLFDGGQELVKGSNLGINPVGTWGFGVSLNKMSFMQLVGLKPGPAVGLIRDALLKAQVSGDVTSRAEAENFVEQYWAKQGLS